MKCFLFRLFILKNNILLTIKSKTDKITEIMQAWRKSGSHKRLWVCGYGGMADAQVSGTCGLNRLYEFNPHRLHQKPKKHAKGVFFIAFISFYG